MINQKDYITLLSTLFLVTIGGVVAGSLILLGLGFSKFSFALEQSNQAKALSNACLEEALQQIQDSIPFTGSGSLSVGQGTCEFTVTSTGGQNRQITSTSTVGTVVRKVKVMIDKITPDINITSWQEVADF